VKKIDFDYVWRVSCYNTAEKTPEKVMQCIDILLLFMLDMMTITKKIKCGPVHSFLGGLEPLGIGSLFIKSPKTSPNN